MSEEKTRLQFLWHFHQPYYSTPDRTSNTLPWVRLHAIKSYYDMGRMLEEHPEIRCVINFSGSLLKQLREYVEVGKRDSWWYLTQKPADNLKEPDKLHLLRHFFSIDWETSVRPVPAYRRLLEKRGQDPENLDTSAFTTQEYRDLQVLFNLAWFGFSARKERAVVQSLIEKGEKFSEDEKRAMLEQQIEVMQLLIPLYRRLHQRGQVEVSVTPMYHPILPLVIDTESARRPTPSRPRPSRLQAPDDARFHVREGRTVVRDVLGVDVDGMWPSEGAISPELVEMFDDHGLQWCASDEEVLENSTTSGGTHAEDLYRPWRLEGSETLVFFRDHELSDQIGFVYGKAGAEEGVDDFMERLRQIDGRESREPPVVSVILDGENPWEHYPNDGEDFLHQLYDRIAGAEDVETVTPGEVVGEHEQVGTLETLHSGSSIRSNFDIWIGGEEDNTAWDLLGETREKLVDKIDEVNLSEGERQKTWEALYIAEGSDWFWWYGDDFTSENDADFDRLFRDQLRYVHRMIGEEVPAELDVSIMQERLPQVPFEAPQRLIKPRIDGRSDYYYEWSGSGIYRNTGAQGSMFENTRYVDEIRIGFDLDNLYVRIEPGEDLMREMSGVGFELAIRGDESLHSVELDIDEGIVGEITSESTAGTVPLEMLAYEESLEFAVPFELIGAEAGDTLTLKLSVWDERMERERHPPHGGFEITVPDESFELVNWMV